MQYGKKLEIIEQIRHELKGENIKAPGIIVIGSQSVGKSSILTRLTGISFPTGEGTCTRSPTVVSVQSDPSVQQFFALVANNASFDDSITCNSEMDVHTAIKDLTVQLMEKASSPITEDPIFIKHTRQRGPAMTLIDLPGITHVSQQDATVNVHAITSGLVRKYMADENMIALVVLNANDDFGNSEALKISMDCDPSGERTIGVVTKCDLVPQTGSDIAEKLHMDRPSDVKLKLGYIAVRNLSRGEHGNVDDLENDFFNAHATLRKLSSNERGISALSEKVIRLQGRSVDRFFTDLKARLYNRTRDLKDDLTAMKVVPRTDEERRKILTGILRQIHDRIETLLRTDDVRDPKLNIPTRTLEFNEKFAEMVQEELPYILGEQFMRKVQNNFFETRGRGLPDMTVDTIVHQMVKEVLLDDVLPTKTMELIGKHESFMMTVYERVIEEKTDGRRFPRLGSFLFTATKDLLLQAKRKAEMMTTGLVEAEREGSFTMNSMYKQMTREMQLLLSKMVNENHSEGKNGVDDDDCPYPNQSNGCADNKGKHVVEVPVLQTVPRIMWQAKVSAEEFGNFINRYVKASVCEEPNPELMRLQFSVHCYLQIVLKRMFDVMPMVVGHVVVHEVHRGFHGFVEGMLTKDLEELKKAMAEDAAEEERREKLTKRISTLSDVYDKVMSS